MLHMRRRSFLRSVAGGLLAGSGSIGRTAAAGTGIRLGFDTYTLNSYGWTAFQFLDYAASQKLDTIQFDLPSFDAAYLKQVREHAKKAGVTIDGGLGCICPTASGWPSSRGEPVQFLRNGLRANHDVGSSVIRCYLGGRGERSGRIPLEAHIETLVKLLRAVRSEALDLGMKFGIEDHGDLLAGEVRDLIEAAGRDFVGATIDTGNPVTLGEDPMVTLEILGPYAVTTHIRDSVVFEHPRGAAVQWVALGEGSIDFVSFFERYRQLCPQVAVNLEILTGRPPRLVPFLEADFWKEFPNAKASEFARFVGLVRKGHSFMHSMMVAPDGQVPPEYTAALRLQQRLDLERSLDYARKTLKLGLRAA